MVDASPRINRVNLFSRGNYSGGRHALRTEKESMFFVEIGELGNKADLRLQITATQEKDISFEKQENVFDSLMKVYQAMVATLGQRVHYIRADSRRKTISKQANTVAIPQQICLHELS